MSKEFFKKYFLVNISDSKGLKPLLFVILYIDAQAAVGGTYAITTFRLDRRRQFSSELIIHNLLAKTIIYQEIN